MEDLPPPIKITPDAPDGNSKNDEPLFEAKVNNPFSKFFKWIKDFIKKQSSITIKIPTLIVVVALSSLGTGLGAYKWGFNDAVSKIFPDSSPILHRAISVEGLIQKSSSGKFYLKSGDNYRWALKAINSAVNLADYTDEQVTVTGNLTQEKSVIEVSEIIPDNASVSQVSQGEALEPKPSTPIQPESSNLTLPDLYSGLKWETTQKRVLIFTSGKRKIEQEGISLESIQLTSYPQDFISYYIESLKEAGFKETFNSISPEGIVVTYAQDELFLTFGVKNIYSGSGDKKQLTGYTAFLEHN